MTSRVKKKRLEGDITLETFIDYGRNYPIVPLCRRFDLEGRTALGLYESFRKSGSPSILLESGERGDSSGRYSFMATEPERIFSVSARCFEEMDLSGQVLYEGSSGDFERRIEEYVGTRHCPLYGELPPFPGGVAGFLGYGMVENWENLFHSEGSRRLRPSPFPDAVMMGFFGVIVIDHVEDKILAVQNVRIPGGSNEKALCGLYERTQEVLKKQAALIEGCPRVAPDAAERACYVGNIRSNMSREDFLSMVQMGKEHIKAGEVSQVVLSQRFTAETDVTPLAVYRSLKRANPSPYMFFLDLGRFCLIGSSPEVLVRLSGDVITTRPLAGTRKRGADAREDTAFARELLADEKERAEHLMLVDLARNDVGKVSETGTVKVTELMEVERYSQVMHIVSNVTGKRAEGAGCLDILRAAFPAGTVSGAPKIRAMEIIEDLEPEPRGPYAGAVGYIGFGGGMDTCITIRTFIHEGDRVHVQAGAGIVYDSVPENEYEETKSKARALFHALEDACGKRGKRACSL